MILCYEPIASIYPSSSIVIMEHLRKICNEKGITVIVNLHQVDVAKNYSDRIVGLNTGEVVFNGHPSEINKEVIQNIYGTDFDEDRKSTRLNSSHVSISYAVFCLKKKHT